MANTPDFSTPPIVELVLGAQFSPLTKLTSGHFGLFWKILGDEWVEPLDDIALDERFETFDNIRRIPSFQIRVGQQRLPNRFKITHKDQERLIQIQNTRFHFNWRRKASFYPSYKQLISEFEDAFEKFSRFVEGNGLGAVEVNQWELTYIDAFPKGIDWQSMEDWPFVLPGLFGKLFSTESLNLSLEQRAAEWSYEITPKLGRLHLSAHTGYATDEKVESLLLNMTARGQVGKNAAESLRRGLDIGHEVAFGAFTKVVNPQLISSWGVKSCQQ